MVADPDSEADSSVGTYFVDFEVSISWVISNVLKDVVLSVEVADVANAESSVSVSEAVTTVDACLGDFDTLSDIVSLGTLFDVFPSDAEAVAVALPELLLLGEPSTPSAFLKWRQKLLAASW